MKSILLFVSSFILSISAIAADSAPEGQSSVTTPQESNQSSAFKYGVSLQASNFEYKEPGVMKASGAMAGFNLMGTYLVFPDIALGANFNYLAGTLNYDGALSDGTPHFSKQKHTIMDFSIKSAFLTDFSSENQTTFLLGLGRRSMIDADDEDTHDYGRQHIYNYYSLGVQVAIPHDSGSVTTPYFVFDNLMSGNVITKLSDFKKSYPDFDMKLKSGSAINLGIQHRMLLTIGELYGNLKYQQWSIAESETATGNIDGYQMTFVEPKNNSTSLSLDVGLLF